MTENEKESPGVSGGFLHSDKTTQLDYSGVFRLSQGAARWLDSVVDAIAEDKISLGQLPLPVTAIYLLGHVHGARVGSGSHEKCEQQIQRLTYERDAWYWRASNPGKSHADFYAAQTDELWRVAA